MKKTQPYYRRHKLKQIVFLLQKHDADSLKLIAKDIYDMSVSKYLRRLVERTIREELAKKQP